MVCLLAAPWVQLSVSAGNGWPHNALRHHWLMPVSCHFRDCKALLVTSLTHVSGAVASVQTFTFTYLSVCLRVCVFFSPCNVIIWYIMTVFRPTDDVCVTLSDCADINSPNYTETVSRQRALHRPASAPASDVTDAAPRKLKRYDNASSQVLSVTSLIVARWGV